MGSDCETLRVVSLDKTNLAAAAAIDASFMVSEEGEVTHSEAGLQLLPRSVTPYRKSYLDAREDLEAAISDDTQAGYVALLDGVVVGVVIVSRDWNGMGLVDCLAVDPNRRGAGIGAALIDKTKAWAKARGLPAVRLETQNNNLVACRFYERQGFALRGFDADLYRADMPGTREVALFLYFWL